jgi:hypothetical protein
MSLNFDTLFGPYQDKTITLYSYDWVDVDSATGYVAYDGTRLTIGNGIIGLNATNKTYNSGSPTSVKEGFKVVPDYDVKLYYVDKDLSCTAYYCYILDSAKNVIHFAPFNAFRANFNEVYLTSGTTYYIVVDWWITNYQEMYASGGYPFTKDHLTFTAGYKEPNEDSWAYNIKYIKTERLTPKYALEKSSERYNLLSYGTSTTKSYWNPTSTTKIADIDFDTSIFQKARNIRGNGYFRVPIRVTGAWIDPTGQEIDYYAVVKVRKWNPTTSIETEIASSQTAANVSTTNETTQSFTIKLNTMITIPDTQIAIGEQLRITIEIYGKVNPSNLFSNMDTKLYHDPLGGALDSLDAGETRSIFIIPYKIEAIST